MELRESVHAFRAAFGVPRGFRETPGGARAESRGALPADGRGEERSAGIHEGARSVAIFRGRVRGRGDSFVRSWRERTAANVEVQAAKERRSTLFERLRSGSARRETRSRGGSGGDGRGRYPRAGRGSEAAWLLFQVPRTAGIGSGSCRGLRGMVASADPRGLGIPGPAGDDHGAAVCFALSRETVQLRLSGLPGPGRSGGHLEAAAAGGDWRSINRGLHDGPGSERERIGVSPPGLHLLQCGRRRKRLGQQPQFSKQSAKASLQVTSPAGNLQTWARKWQCEVYLLRREISGAPR